MKSFNLFLVYILSFMVMFLTLSAIGLLWVDSYHAIISNVGWFMVYTLFIGSWAAIFPAREYYIANESYFARVF